MTNEREEATGGRVRVKDLEWVTNDDNLNFVSHTVAGRYAISEYPGMVEPFRLYVPQAPERVPFPTFVEAKAAAQADFNSRIISSLVMTP